MEDWVGLTTTCSRLLLDIGPSGTRDLWINSTRSYTTMPPSHQYTKPFTDTD